MPHILTVHVHVSDKDVQKRIVGKSCTIKCKVFVGLEEFNKRAMKSSKKERNKYKGNQKNCK